MSTNIDGNFEHIKFEVFGDDIANSEMVHQNLKPKKLYMYNKIHRFKERFKQATFI